jgi:hypothetical protein
VGANIPVLISAGLLYKVVLIGYAPSVPWPLQAVIVYLAMPYRDEVAALLKDLRDRVALR